MVVIRLYHHALIILPLVILLIFGSTHLPKAEDYKVNSLKISAAMADTQANSGNNTLLSVNQDASEMAKAELRTDRAPAISSLSRGTDTQTVNASAKAPASETPAKAPDKAPTSKTSAKAPAKAPAPKSSPAPVPAPAVQAPSPAAPAPSSPAGAKAQAIIATAQKYLGVPYVWGGEKETGFDCSGFTNFVFAKHGITLPRVSRDQFKTGKAVSFGSLQPADLVFFSIKGNGVADHVGIFVGDGKFIHASSSQGVTISTFSSYWKPKFLGARRVL